MFKVRWKAVRDFDDFGAGTADEVVMMIVAVRDEFEARRAVAEVEAMDHAHFFEEMHGAIDRGQVAFAGRQGGEDFLGGNGVFAMAQNIENGLARSGDLAGFSAKTLGEVFKVFAAFVVWMRTLIHAGLRVGKIAIERNARETMNKPMHVRTIAGPHGTSR